jgi:hypothetical protein
VVVAGAEPAGEARARLEERLVEGGDLEGVDVDVERVEGNRGEDPLGDRAEPHDERVGVREGEGVVVDLAPVFLR